MNSIENAVSELGCASKRWPLSVSHSTYRTHKTHFIKTNLMHIPAYSNRFKSTAQLIALQPPTQFRAPLNTNEHDLFTHPFLANRNASFRIQKHLTTNKINFNPFTQTRKNSPLKGSSACNPNTPHSITPISLNPTKSHQIKPKKLFQPSGIRRWTPAIANFKPRTLNFKPAIQANS
jgi:hypothetical protein